MEGDGSAGDDTSTRPHPSSAPSPAPQRSASTPQKRFVVIREVYENGNSAEEFEAQLDCALVEGVALILIEPASLGEETGRWIALGNFLHKSAVLAGLGALCTDWLVPQLPRLLVGPVRAPIWHHRLAPSCSFTAVSMGLFSVTCAGVYALCWQWDPCCKYQVERDATCLKDVLPLSRLSPSSAPVVLTRRDDFGRKLLHNSIALLVLASTCHRVYRWWQDG